MNDSINDVIKNIRDIAALPSSGLTGYRKHLTEWADKLQHAVTQQESRHAEIQKAFDQFSAVLQDSLRSTGR
jgi:hypothetical protein